MHTQNPWNQKDSSRRGSLAGWGGANRCVYGEETKGCLSCEDIVSGGKGNCSKSWRAAHLAPQTSSVWTLSMCLARVFTSIVRKYCVNTLFFPPPTSLQIPTNHENHPGDLEICPAGQFPVVLVWLVPFARQVWDNPFQTTHPISNLCVVRSAAVTQY